MWIQVKSASNKMIADMWKDLFEGEGVPTKLLPDDGFLVMSEKASYKVLVPSDKTHVIEEILRKI